MTSFLYTASPWSGGPASPVQVTLHENGTASLRVTAKTWLKAICLLAALFWGHAQMQCQKIEAVATDMQKVSERLSLTEQSLKAVIQSQDTLKQEHKETTRELREIYAS